MTHKKITEGLVYEGLQERFVKRMMDEAGVRLRKVVDLGKGNNGEDICATLVDSQSYSKEVWHGNPYGRSFFCSTNEWYNILLYSISSPQVALWLTIEPKGHKEYCVIGREEDINEFERLLQEEAFPHEVKGINGNIG